MIARSRTIAIVTTLLVTTCAATSLAQTTHLSGSRLFTTPDQRAKLDELRNAPAPRPVVKKRTAAVAVNKPVPPKPLPRVEVKGVVIRSNGPATAWVNDGNTLEGAQIKGGIRVQTGEDGQARVTLPNRSAVALKPGEAYNPNNGTTTGIHIRKTP